LSRKVILYRGQDFEENELPAAQAAGFYCTNSRMDIEPGDRVVGRFSVLPFYREQERDLNRMVASLINTSTQHEYVAYVGQWYPDLIGLTPKTYFPGEWQSLPENKSFVVKGQTNSKKFLWSTHMFAQARHNVQDVVGRLLDDSMIGEQGLVVREYAPLMQFMVGMNGLPITHEYRFFVCNSRILSGGFYWSSHVEDLKQAGLRIPPVSDVPDWILDNAIAAIGDKCAFYAIDIARCEDGSWTVIELNDGQMSGLSENDPVTLYKNLYEAM